MLTIGAIAVFGSIGAAVLAAVWALIAIELRP